jgi:hypothetical protein
MVFGDQTHLAALYRARSYTGDSTDEILDNGLAGYYEGTPEIVWDHMNLREYLNWDKESHLSSFDPNNPPDVTWIDPSVFPELHRTHAPHEVWEPDGGIKGIYWGKLNSVTLWPTDAEWPHHTHMAYFIGRGENLRQGDILLQGDMNHLDSWNAEYDPQLGEYLVTGCSNDNLIAMVQRQPSLLKTLFPINDHHTMTRDPDRPFIYNPETNTIYLGPFYASHPMLMYNLGKDWNRTDLLNSGLTGGEI